MCVVPCCAGVRGLVMVRFRLVGRKVSVSGNPTHQYLAKSLASRGMHRSARVCLPSGVLSRLLWRRWTLVSDFDAVLPVRSGGNLYWKNPDRPQGEFMVIHDTDAEDPSSLARHVARGCLSVGLKGETH